MQLVLLAKKANPNNNILYTNLALSYLLTDDWVNAKEVYTTWQDSTYNSPYIGRDIITLRNSFLKDLDNLEKEGISHPDFEKVRELLKEEE
jgi:hypothetical protein